MSVIPIAGVRRQPRVRLQAAEQTGQARAAAEASDVEGPQLHDERG
jgi:hypothetical protein